MPTAQKQPNWLPYAGLALTLAAMIYQGGVLSNRVTQNEQRIAEMRLTLTSQWNKLNEMNDRGARNEEKLNFLVQEALENNRKKGK